eukprot:scaffold5728_cov36-Tisochrysis_lutea.AAC.2
MANHFSLADKEPVEAGPASVLEIGLGGNSLSGRPQSFSFTFSDAEAPGAAASAMAMSAGPSSSTMRSAMAAFPREVSILSRAEATRGMLCVSSGRDMRCVMCPIDKPCARPSLR